MSEKDARYCLKLLRDEMPDSIDKALADDPDAVTGLRHIEEELASAKKVLKAARRKRACVDEGYARASERVNVLLGFKRWWVAKFHVRLTKTGWEWTDDTS